MASSHRPITVLVAGRSDLIRRGLSDVFRCDSRFTVIGETSADVIALAQHLRPDLIVVDPAGDSDLGIRVADELHDVAPGSPVVILAPAFLLESLMSAIQKHVYGYFREEFATEADRFLEALIPIARSHVVSVDPVIAERFQASAGTIIQLHEPGDEAGRLTPREREVLTLFLQEFDDKAIAKRLHIDRSTVEYHVEQARRKLGAANRIQLGWLLRERGLL